MLGMFTDMKHCLVCMSFNGLKCSERDVRTLYDPRSVQPSTAQNLATVAKIQNQWPKAIT